MNMTFALVRRQKSEFRESISVSVWGGFEASTVACRTDLHQPVLMHAHGSNNGLAPSLTGRSPSCSADTSHPRIAL